MLIQTSETSFYCSAPVSSTSFKKKKKREVGGKTKGVIFVIYLQDVG